MSTKKYPTCAALLPVVLLSLSQSVVAQQPPTGGGQLQQIPPAPVAPRAAPEIRIEQRGIAPAPAPAADSVRILVRTLRITGASLYPEAELLALTGFTPGEYTLADLQHMASRISEFYRRNGYFVAQALVPAQDIRDNAVTIAVSEGRYGTVNLRNQTNLADHVARSPLRGIQSGDPIETVALENRMLLLSDLPGVHVRSTLVPGTAPGTSDLIVDITPGRRVTGSVDIDNAGNRYTGAWRAGGTVNINNPFGLGDVISLRALTSGSGLQYGRASWQVQVGRGQVGVAYSRLDYELGKEFEPLGAHGRATVASVFGRYPILRTRDDNVNLLAGFDAKRFHDVVDSVPAVTDRRTRVLSAGVQGEHNDTLGGGGASTYLVMASAGELDIETPAARAADALTARSNGRFGKLSYHLARLQRVGGPFSVYGAVQGQFASKNLDVSEKMELGGMHAVRAYPEGEAFADQGYVLTLEGRMDLPRFSDAQVGQVQLIAFVDTGRVTINKEPWAPGDNRRSLSGAGIGAVWSDPGNFLLRAFYARKLGNGVATSAPDRSGRFWIQAVKYF